MGYRLREAAGWVLVGVGLWMFYGAFGLWELQRPLGAAGMTVAGIFVFRGGIHVLKVAVAARVCERADERLYPAVRRPPAVSGSTLPPPSR